MTDTNRSQRSNRATESTDAAGSEPTAGDRPSRRGILKTAATSLALGTAGLAASTGTAAAGDGECPYTYPDAPSWIGEVEPEAWSFHEWPWGSGDITIFVHGFTNQNGGRNYTYEVLRNLSDQGYGGNVVACDWNAGDSWDEWYSAKDHSIEAGQDLAEMIDYYGWTESNGVTLNLVAHSLGGKFALECVRDLYATYAHSINSVNLFGAAVWDEQPGDRFHDGILYGTNGTHNYYSENDDTLGDFYQSAEFGRHACGYTGGAGGEPWNWYEHDMTSRITHHCQYVDYDDGCVWYVDDDL